MTKETIAEIKNAMATCLLPEQMKRLESVLERFIGDTDKENNSDKEKNNSEYLDSFLATKRMEGCSPQTEKLYTFVIKKYTENIMKDIRLVDTEDIRKYLSEYQSMNNCSGVSLDNIRRVLSSYYKWLEEEDYIIKSPMRRIHRIKAQQTVKEPLADEEIEQLRSECAKKLRDTAIIDMLLSSGIRVGELVKLNKNSVNLAERSCVVLGKGNKERVVYFDVRTKIEIERYLKTRKDNNDALFVSEREYKDSGRKRLSINAVESFVRNIGKRKLIVKVHPHRFRRTMATRAIDKGMPIEQVQVLLGHTQIATTLRYAMVQQKNVRIAHQKYLC